MDEVLARFLAEADPTGEAEGVVELLRAYLDGYGHQMLSEEEAAFFQERYDVDPEASAFCNLFGPEYILEGLPEFLGWFVIRKVMAGPELTAAFGPVTDGLVAWLVRERVVSEEAADGAAELTTAATRDLPAAEELSSLLYDSRKDVDNDAVLEYVDWEPSSPRSRVSNQASCGSRASSARSVPWSYPSGPHRSPGPAGV